MTILISVIGNIGSGKTSITSSLAQKLVSEVISVNEPVEEWVTSGLLAKFYEDKRKYALEMQWNAVCTRHRNVENTLSACGEVNILINDGHILTDKHAFVETLCGEGSMSEEDKETYDRRFETKFPTRPSKNEHFIYLHCSPQVCLERVKNRGRGEEKDLKIDYLRRLHDNFETFVSMPDITEKVHRIEVSSLDFETVVDKAVDIVYEIKQFY